MAVGAVPPRCPESHPGSRRHWTSAPVTIGAIVEAVEARVGDSRAVGIADPLADDGRVTGPAGGVPIDGRGPGISGMVRVLVGAQGQREAGDGGRDVGAGDIVAIGPGCDFDLPTRRSSPVQDETAVGIGECHVLRGAHTDARAGNSCAALLD